MNTNGGLLLAFLPQFLAPGNGQIAQQMAVLGLTFAGFGLCFLIALGYVAGAVGAWLAHSPQYTTLLRRLTGGILISLGVRLAFIEQR